MTEVREMSTDPRQAGGRYVDAYWQQEYTVTAAETIHGMRWVTVRWADGQTTRHCTPWDARRDRVISQPA